MSNTGSAIGLLVCVSLLAYVRVFADPAPFQLCTERPIDSTRISLDVSGCNNPERCPLYRGTSHNFTIRFTPNVSSNNGVERLIIAKFPRLLRGRPVEVPYGGAVNGGDHTFKDNGGQTVNEVGIIQNEPYTHNYTFPVMSTAPKTSLIVRYIIRERVQGLNRRRSEWKIHPGKLFTCVEIPVQLQ